MQIYLCIQFVTHVPHVRNAIGSDRRKVQTVRGASSQSAYRRGGGGEEGGRPSLQGGERREETSSGNVLQWLKRSTWQRRQYRSTSRVGVVEARRDGGRGSTGRSSAWCHATPDLLSCHWLAHESSSPPSPDWSTLPIIRLIGRSGSSSSSSSSRSRVCGYRRWREFVIPRRTRSTAERL